MRNAETILSLRRERGKQNLPNECIDSYITRVYTCWRMGKSTATTVQPPLVLHQKASMECHRRKSMPSLLNSAMNGIGGHLFAESIPTRKTRQKRALWAFPHGRINCYRKW